MTTVYLLQSLKLVSDVIYFLYIRNKISLFIVNFASFFCSPLNSRSLVPFVSFSSEKNSQFSIVSKGEKSKK